MSCSIANTICRICANASDSMKDLDKILEIHQTLKNMSEVRLLKDSLEEILVESYILKESIGYKVDEWCLDYLRD